MVGRQVVVHSVPSVVVMKFVVTPCPKGAYQHNGMPNVGAENSQDLVCLESDDAAIPCIFKRSVYSHDSHRLGLFVDLS